MLPDGIHTEPIESHMTSLVSWAIAQIIDDRLVRRGYSSFKRVDHIASVALLVLDREQSLFFVRSLFFYS